ncbi:MAG: dienelactone hydrolase family protein [Actinomycetota bacterium]|nr:dienelactone hydrolase family protein [Actinomycetota bacterium]
MQFDDRRAAGRQLAERLTSYAHEDAIVVGLPRGGIPVAYEVAHALRAPLDTLVVRKVGAPHNPEYGVGAVGEEGVVLMNDEAVRGLRISQDALEEAVGREREELERRLERYRSGRPAVGIGGHTVIVVDDGLATGVSATAAAQVLRERGAGRRILAVPVGAPDSLKQVAEHYDEVVCLHAPSSFMAVGSWYRDFGQTRDDTVVELLSRAYDELPAEKKDDTAAEPAQEPGPDHGNSERQVEVAAGELNLPGDLSVPGDPRGLVIFAHGSGSSRRSPRNRHVASLLNDAGFATLLFDLLTDVEERDRGNVFDIPLLGRRLISATLWARQLDEFAGLPVGFFGASTGAAAALVAAAELGREVQAVVSRGGRPDLAMERLGDVTVPTLLIVGGRDEPVIAMNEQAAKELRGQHELVIVPGATHLFEEAGALDEVAKQAGEWFSRHLPG